MKKLIITFLLAVAFCNSQVKPPYEATWMEITKTDSSYVVYNYPNLVKESIKSPMKIIVKGESLTWVPFSDTSETYKLDNIQNLGNEIYFFKVGNYFKFEWFDKEKHIARWSIYHGDDISDDRIATKYLYIDSVYNTYPIVDYIWEDGPIDED